jgi:hypothetical protein
MSTEIALHRVTMPEKITYAEHLAYAGLLPEAYRGKPANVLYAIEYGETIGIGTMAAITGVHIIKGKPSASSSLIGALVRRAGHRLRVTGNDRQAQAIVIRADDPDFEYRSEWTLERAVIAKLCTLKDGRPYARDSKGDPTAWEKYPAAMLKARAITEVARDACEEVLFGLHYTAEELGVETDAEGVPVAEVLEAVGRKAQREQPTEPADDQFAVPPPATPKPPTTGMVQKLAMLVTQKAGTLNREQRLAFTSLHLGRPVPSWRDLTFTDVHRLIDILGALPDHIADAEIVGDDAGPPVSHPNPRNGSAPAAPTVVAALATPTLGALVSRTVEGGAPVEEQLYAAIVAAQIPQELARLFKVAEEARDAGQVTSDGFERLNELGKAANADMLKAQGDPSWAARGMADAETKGAAA